MFLHELAVPLDDQGLVFFHVHEFQEGTSDLIGGVRQEDTILLNLMGATGLHPDFSARNDGERRNENYLSEGVVFKSKV